MAASIGGVSCWDILGRPPGLEEATIFETVEGYDGVEAETIGRRGGAFSIIALQHDELAVVEAWIADLEALAGGDPVTITLNDGTAFTNCYIGAPNGMAVRVQKKDVVLEGGSTKYNCEAVVMGHRSAT